MNDESTEDVRNRTTSDVTLNVTEKGRTPSQTLQYKLKTYASLEVRIERSMHREAMR